MNIVLCIGLSCLLAMSDAASPELKLIQYSLECLKSAVTAGRNTLVTYTDEASSTHLKVGGKAHYTCPANYEWTMAFKQTTYSLICQDLAAVELPTTVKDAARQSYFVYVNTKEDHSTSERTCRAYDKFKFRGHLAAPFSFEHAKQIASMTTANVNMRLGYKRDSAKHWVFEDGSGAIYTNFMIGQGNAASENSVFMARSTMQMYDRWDNITKTFACEFDLLASEHLDVRPVPDCVMKQYCDMSTVAAGANTVLTLQQELNNTHLRLNEGRAIYKCEEGYEWESITEYTLDCKESDAAAIDVPKLLKDDSTKVYYALVKKDASTFDEAKAICESDNGQFNGWLSMPRDMAEILKVQSWATTVSDANRRILWFGVKRSSAPCSAGAFNNFEYEDGRPLSSGSEGLFATGEPNSCTEEAAAIDLGKFGLMRGAIDVPLSTYAPFHVLCEFRLPGAMYDAAGVPQVTVPNCQQKPSCDITPVKAGLNTVSKLNNEMDATRLNLGGSVAFTCSPGHEWEGYSGTDFTVECIDPDSIGLPVLRKLGSSHMYYAIINEFTNDFEEAQAKCALAHNGKFEGKLAMPETMSDMIRIEKWIALHQPGGTLLWLGAKRTEPCVDPWLGFEFLDGQPVALDALGPFANGEPEPTDCNQRWTCVVVKNAKIGIHDTTALSAAIMCEFSILDPTKEKKKVPSCVNAVQDDTPMPCWSSPCGKAAPALTTAQKPMFATASRHSPVVCMAVLIIVFLVILDFSVQRVFHFVEELTLLIAHALIIPARSNTVMDSGAFCDPAADPGYAPTELSKFTCTTIAVILHYMYLAHFLALFLESLHNYTANTMVYVKKMLFSRLVALGLLVVLPFIVVLITAIGFWNSYTAKKTCWCNVDSVNFMIEISMMFILAALALIINEATTIKKYPLHPAQNAQIRLAAASSARGGTLVSVLSCATWLTGVQAVYNNDLALYTLVSILNIVLAVVIVLVHAMGSAQVVQILKKLCCFCCASDKKVV